MLEQGSELPSFSRLSGISCMPTPCWLSLICWWMRCRSYPLAVGSHAPEARIRNSSRDLAFPSLGARSRRWNCWVSWRFAACVFTEPPCCFSVAGAPFSFPPAMHEAQLSVHPQQSHPDRREVVSGLPSEVTLSETEQW